MKSKLVLLLLMVSPVLARPPLNWRSQPAPVGTWTAHLRNNIDNPALRIGVGCVLFYLAATDNPIRTALIKKINAIQRYFNKIKEAERKNKILVRNMRTMKKTFMALV